MPKSKDGSGRGESPDRLPLKKGNMPEQRCPHCGYAMDSAQSLSNPDADPSPGDYTICLDCGELSKFLFNLSMVKLTTDEEVEFFLEGRRDVVNRVKRAQTLIKTRAPWRKKP